MFRTNDSPKHVEPFNEKMKTIHKNLCSSLVYIHIARLVASLNTFIRDKSNDAELCSSYRCDARHCCILVVLIRAATKLVLLLDLFMTCCHNTVQVFKRFIGYRYQIWLLRSRHFCMISILNKCKWVVSKDVTLNTKFQAFVLSD